MITRLGHHYAWASPDFILKKLTWRQVWLYYEYCFAHLQDKDTIERDTEEPPPLDLPGTIVKKDGTRIYGR